MSQGRQRHTPTAPKTGEVTPLNDSLPTQTPADEIRRVTRDLLADQVERIATRLHELADEVSRLHADIERVPAAGRPNFALVACDVQHEVLWRVANLSLDVLTRLAADADEARREAQP